MGDFVDRETVESVLRAGRLHNHNTETSFITISICFRNIIYLSAMLYLIIISVLIKTIFSMMHAKVCGASVQVNHSL